jgi:putative aldouronate transport system substrate-binding protein
LVSAKVGNEKLIRIVELMNETADPANFNLISFGIEGIHHTIVDGFPKLTEQGEKEITNALPYPFTYATLTFAKVDSPLADVAYNLETREMTQEGLDTVAASYVNPMSLDILQSNSWATFWSQRKDEFEAFATDVITGEKSVDDFRNYQKKLREDPLVIKSFDELQKSYDDFGLPKQ